MGGNDRLWLTGGETAAMYDGGDGLDTLVVDNGVSVTMTDAHFASLERVEVMDGGSVDMSGYTAVAGVRETIKSDSTAGGSVGIVGTDRSDLIVGGKGSDTIDGGGGNDRIFVGSGATTFDDMMTGFGRDVIYNAGATIAQDTFDVSAIASSASDLHFWSINGGADTLVWGTDGHSATSDSFVLKGISVDQAESAHFVYGSPAIKG